MWLGFRRGEGEFVGDCTEERKGRRRGEVGEGLKRRDTLIYL